MQGDIGGSAFAGARAHPAAGLSSLSFDHFGGSPPLRCACHARDPASSAIPSSRSERERSAPPRVSTGTGLQELHTSAGEYRAVTSSLKLCNGSPLLAGVHVFGDFSVVPATMPKDTASKPRSPILPTM